MEKLNRENLKKVKKYLIRKRLFGIVLGLFLSIIVLKVDKKLWWPLELEVLNARNSTNFIKQNKSHHQKIAIVLFDDKTQFLLRNKGVPIKDFEKKGRELIKLAIEKLEANNVKAIGINLNLNTPSDPRIDNELAKTISSYKNIVIADSVHSPQTQKNIILKSAGATGFGEIYPEYDRVVHKASLIDKINNNKHKIFSFPYALYKIVNKSKTDESLNDQNQFYIKYPNNEFSKYSFIDLISNNIELSKLTNKTVILGSGLKSKLITDKILTPFEKSLFISDSEIQATILQNLLDKTYLNKVSLYDFKPLFVLFSIFLGVTFSCFPIVTSLIIGTTMFILFTLFSQILYSQFQLVLETTPILFLFLGNLLIGLLIYLQINLQQQNINLEEAFEMLNKQTKELEISRVELETKNIELTSALTELNQKIYELKEVRKQLSSRSEEERRRIARDLHDDTLSRITDLKIIIGSLINSKETAMNEKQELIACAQTLENVTSEVRRIINALRPSMLDNVLGLIPAIENLLDDLRKRSNNKIQTKLYTSLSKLKLQDSQEINLYRIIQEALNNVYKHSNATKVELSILEQPGQLLFLVSDNGIGLNKNLASKGYGLIDMKERAELIGAQIQYLNKPDRAGATLEIVIPYVKEAKEKQKVPVELSY